MCQWRNGMVTTLVSRILQLAIEQPTNLAVISNKESLTYAELAKQIKSIGTYLAFCGVKKGDRVLLTAVPKTKTVAAYLGIQYCGATVVFTDKNCTVKSAEAIYDETKAVLFLTDKPMKALEYKMKLLSLKKAYYTECIDKYIDYVVPSENDMAEIILTTGTTGKPKGVIHTYKSIYNILANTIEGIGIMKEERILLPLPLSHSFALRVLRAAIFQGATVILQNGFAFAKDVENNQKIFQCTAMIAVPATMEMLYEQMGERFSEVLGRFRYIEIGAGSLSIAQRKKFLKLLPDTVIYNTWGSSETGGVLFLNIADTLKESETLGAVGKPLPYVQLKVLDDNGNVIESSAENPGRMALKGDMGMAGYWNETELTLRTIHDGWILTNDIVYLGENGYVYMLGRSDDIINVGGEKVSTINVENIAGQYEFIKECACIGVEDPQAILGQIPVLFVVTKNTNYKEKDLQIFLSKYMERYKIPKEYILVSELPRNQMGKIDRNKLRDMVH
jgi:long-chain acyl-CoA synthetase